MKNVLMQAKLETINKGRYYLLRMGDDTQAEDFLRFYSITFMGHKNAPLLEFLIDVTGQPAVMGPDEFRNVLHHADECNIREIHMHIVSDDPARPLIGDMVAAMCEGFVTNIRLFFYPTFEEGQNAVEV